MYYDENVCFPIERIKETCTMGVPGHFSSAWNTLHSVSTGAFSFCIFMNLSYHFYSQRLYRAVIVWVYVAMVTSDETLDISCAFYYCFFFLTRPCWLSPHGLDVHHTIVPLCSYWDVILIRARSTLAARTKKQLKIFLFPFPLNYTMQRVRSAC